MRWNQIVSEELSVVQLAKSYIMDILSSLKAQGVQSITVDQIVQQLSQSPDFEGTEIDQGLINAALEGVQNVKIEPNPEDGKMTVFVDDPSAGRQVDQNQAEKDDKAIHSAALRSIDKKDSE